MNLIALLSAVAVLVFQPTAPPDPHFGSFTTELGVECSYCHEPGVWKTSSLPAFDMAARMEKMTKDLSDGLLQSSGGISCITCHHNAPKPARLLPAAWQKISDEWPESAKVSDANATKPAREVYKNLKNLGDLPAGDIRMTMSVFASSLGVGCEYCHAADEWDSDNKPAKKTARFMLKLFDEMPKAFDPQHVPTFQCFTCHQGAATPLQ